ncbi:MAG: hypothetical protein AAB497_01065 [Patescibacteria group bacterium]
MNDYDDLYRESSNPWSEKPTKRNLKFKCKGCGEQVNKWYEQATIDSTPGCEKFCSSCLLRMERED